MEADLLHTLGQSLHPALTISRTRYLGFIFGKANIACEHILGFSGVIYATDLLPLWHVPIDVSCDKWSSDLVNPDGTLRAEFKLKCDRMLAIINRIKKAVRCDKLRNNVAVTASLADGTARIIIRAFNSFYNLEFRLESKSDDLDLYGYHGLGAPSINIVSLEEWVDVLKSPWH